MLSTVEVNSSFYRLPSAETFERWAATVPDGFRFAVKMPRAITVYGRVDDAPAFCERVRALGDRLGPLLVRPADDRKRDDGFLRALLDGIDDDLWPAFDLRHPSWDGVEELLEGRDAVRVNQLDAPAPFRYLRLREPPYDDAALAAGRIACARCSTTGSRCTATSCTRTSPRRRPMRGGCWSSWRAETAQRGARRSAALAGAELRAGSSLDTGAWRASARRRVLAHVLERSPATAEGRGAAPSGRGPVSAIRR